MTYPLHRFRFACAVLLAGFTFAASSTRAADIKMPAELPPYGPMQLPQAPKVQSEKLANGLTVWLVQQNNLPKAAVRLTLR